MEWVAKIDWRDSKPPTVPDCRLEEGVLLFRLDLKLTLCTRRLGGYHSSEDVAMELDVGLGVCRPWGPRADMLQSGSNRAATRSTWLRVVL